MKVVLIAVALLLGFCLLPGLEARNCSQQVTCKACLGNQTKLFNPECLWCSGDSTCRPIGRRQLPEALHCVPNCKQWNSLTLPGYILLVFAFLGGGILTAIMGVKLCGRWVEDVAIWSWLRSRISNMRDQTSPFVEDGCNTVDNMSGARCQEWMKNDYRQGEEAWGLQDLLSLDKLTEHDRGVNGGQYFTVALSGGGIRAAAHSLGLITSIVDEWERTEEGRHETTGESAHSGSTDDRRRTRTFVGPIGIISSVSGGGCTAAGILAHLQDTVQREIQDEHSEVDGSVKEEVVHLMNESEGAKERHAKESTILQNLASRVLRSPSYLGGSNPLSSTGALKMITAILTRATVLVMEFCTLSFLLGLLLSSLCSCGSSAAGDGKCYNSGLLWLCPDFLQGNGEECPSRDFLDGQQHLLFGVTRVTAWISVLIVITAVPFLVISFHCVTKFKLVGRLVPLLLVGAGFLLTFFSMYWDLCVLMLYAVLQFQATTGNAPLFILILFCGFLVGIAGLIMHQANSMVWKASGWVLMGLAFIFCTTGFPGWFGVLGMCWTTELVQGWVLLGLAAVSCFLVVFDRLFLRNLILKVYATALRKAFFPKRSSRLRLRTGIGPYLALNACVHGPPEKGFENQPYDHFLFTPTFFGSEGLAPPAEPWRRGWHTSARDEPFSVNDLELSMGLSAAAVAPRAGSTQLPIVVRALLSILDISMGKWVSLSKGGSWLFDLAHTGFFDTVPEFFLYMAVLSSYTNLALFLTGVLLWCLLLLWNLVLCPLMSARGGLLSRLSALNCRRSAYFIRITQLLSLRSLPGDPIYVADGGHFENLGLYYLVRRKAPVILCSDAAQDTKNSDLFRSLSVLKAHGFWFSTIDLQRREVQISKDTEVPVFQIIKYGNGTNNMLGVIFIVKIAFPAHHTLPPDVHGYFSMQEQGAFSIDSTANQFFSPEQFRAYQELAQSNTRELLNALAWACQEQPPTVAVVSDQLSPFELEELGGYGGAGAPAGFTKPEPRSFQHPADPTPPKKTQRKDLISAVWRFVLKAKEQHELDQGELGDALDKPDASVHSSRRHQSYRTASTSTELQKFDSHSLPLHLSPHKDEDED